VKTLFIEPRSPWENGYMKSFNGKLGGKLFNREIFDILTEAKILIERRSKEYNEIKPCSSLDYKTLNPVAYKNHISLTL